MADIRSGEWFEAARERGFVGRRQESALFGDLLERNSGSVLFVHGPGGIGKTTLLHHFAHLAAQRGHEPVLRDARDVLLPGTGPERGPEAHGPGRVLLLDAADALPEEALRQELPTLPLPDLVTVLAARNAPPVAWRVDPAWRELLHSLRLGPLDTEESLRLLRGRGMPGVHGQQEENRILAFARGHPLALALAADIEAHGGVSGDLSPADSPQIVRTLLDCLLESVPSPLHRTALEATAQVLVTTESLLAELLDVPDAGPVFAWLRTLSAMDHVRHGIRPHDLVRDALDAELRWRHPDLRTKLRKRAGAYYLRLFDETDLDRQRAVLPDYAYLHRESPVVGPVLTSALPPSDDGLDRLAVAPGTPADLDALCAMVRRHEGAQSADLLRDWSRGHPAFEPYAIRARTIRPDGGAPEPSGCYALLWLSGGDRNDGNDHDGPGTAAGPEGTAAEVDDPAVHAVRRWLAGPGGLRAGEQALFVRFWLDAEIYQGPSPVQLLITLRLTHHYLTARSPALTLLPFADPDAWAEGCAYVGFGRLPEADFTVGGITYGMFVHDWRRNPRDVWLRQLTAQGATTTPVPSPAPPAFPDQPVLDQDQFAAAVREALRRLDRVDGLDDSPLLDTRLVRTQCAAHAGPRERATVLREAIATAAAQLEASVADRRGFRALHHTFLRPAGTQQRAADLLGLPMTTYRRHLAAGTDRLTTLLWQQELSTEPPPTRARPADRRPGEAAPPVAEPHSRVTTTRVDTSS